MRSVRACVSYLCPSYLLGLPNLYVLLTVDFWFCLPELPSKRLPSRALLHYLYGVACHLPAGEGWRHTLCTRCMFFAC